MTQQQVEQHGDEASEAVAFGAAVSPWLGALLGTALALLLLVTHALPHWVNH